MIKVCNYANCDVEFESNNNKKYCSTLCSSRKRNGESKIRLNMPCKVCDTPTKNVYCSNHNYTDFRVKQWLEGLWDGSNRRRLSPTIRNYLLKLENYSCSLCGFNTNHPDDGSSILEIDHIDGNGDNHSKDNLRVVCPNCHALTSTYRGRNVGNGRNVYYSRIIKD